MNKRQIQKELEFLVKDGFIHPDDVITINRGYLVAFGYDRFLRGFRTKCMRVLYKNSGNYQS